jgi:hypothetical protein
MTELTELRRRLPDAIRETDARLTGRERRPSDTIRKVAVGVWTRLGPFRILGVGVVAWR